MNDGTIRDNETGLIWLKDASCSALLGTNPEGRADWDTANSAAADLADGTCGLTDGSEAGDWRLPAKEEWEGYMSTVYYLSYFGNLLFQSSVFRYELTLIRGKKDRGD